MKSIEVTIHSTGEMEIEALGFRGGECTRATEAIEQAIGAVRTRKKKPEYFQQTAARQNQQSSFGR